MDSTARIALFKEELDSIPLANFRNWLESCLCIAPDYFFEVGASESMTHHPYWDLGPGGTVRHSKAVTKLAVQMLPSRLPADPLCDQSLIQTSRVIVACVLHDSGKYGIQFDMSIYPLHPYLPRLMFANVDGISVESKEWIFCAIEAHMGAQYDGRWSLIPGYTNYLFKHDQLFAIVHQADYLASRMDFIDMRFIDVNKDVPVSTLTPYDPYSDEFIFGLVVGVVKEYVTDVVLAKAITDGRIQLLADRCMNLRSPYAVRKKEYNLNGIINCVRANIKSFMPESEG